ncbi:hypothetical protein ERC79_19220 [Rhodococcus sp. ABRD24]|uniref:AMIN-like domain-containing (lipo)protein n=1 Tax=Rhodococcus sp. ABRD24 TaxID=2507582 RepID=UPI00103EC284|nr:hypothetical protein [Rhodococcus sp. ABRD24]QBJ97834.1 hypothetical protein ERC79_19220 [Rhodococcus sp. ABRD24]
MTHFRHRRTVALFSVAAAALALAGCSDAESEPTASTTSITPSSDAGSNAGSKAAAAPFHATEGTMTAVPTGEAAQTASASPESALTVTDIRIGSHDGFDRVVYELGGSGTPGWRTRIVTTAAQQGSGKPIEVDGEAILEVLIDGSAYPFESGVEPYRGQNPLAAAPGGVVLQVADAGVFEGVTQTFVGLSRADAQYRVYTLDNPTRVVVDVAR